MSLNEYKSLQLVKRYILVFNRKVCKVSLNDAVLVLNAL